MIFDEFGVKLKSINNKNGKKIWEYNNNIDNFFINTNGKLIETKKDLIYIFSNKKLIIINKINGKKLKSINIKSNNKNIRLKKTKIYNNILYICYENGRFEIINLNSGKKIFNNKKNNYNNFFIDKRHLIILKKNGKIVKVNKFNGKKIWSNNFFKNKIIKKIILDKNIIVLNKNLIYFFNNNGELLKNKKIKNEEKINENIKNIIALNK